MQIAASFITLPKGFLLYISIKSHAYQVYSAVKRITYCVDYDLIYFIVMELSVLSLSTFTFTFTRTLAPWF